jgi:hypothetical protein
MAWLRRRGRRIASPSSPGYRVFSPPLGLWIAGVDYTSKLIADSPQIRSTAYAQTGVFSFRLDGSIAALAGVTVEQEVTFNKGGVTYAGRIRTITPEDLRPIGLALNIECQDFTSLLAESICAFSNAYTNPVRTTVETDQARIAWLLQSYDRYGISASHVQTLTASMPAQDFTGMTLNDAIKAVLEFGNGSFYVDFAKDLHTFTGAEPNPAPFGLSDAPDDVTTFAFAEFSYPKDSVDLVNAVYAVPGRAAATFANSVSEAITASGPNGAMGVMASFKAAPGRNIAPVSMGPFTPGTNTSVSPTFGTSTQRGNVLIAWVAGDGLLTPTTSAPGWVKLIEPQQGPLLWPAIWVKLVSAQDEAPPVFTDADGAIPMYAQLSEWSGIDPTAPIDRTTVGLTTGAGPLVLQAGQLDAAMGDLIILATRWSVLPAGGASFVDTFNNAAAVRAGDSGAITSSSYHACFSYGIVPTAGARWYTDEASIATYGRREASISDTSVTTQAGLDLLGAAYLAAHKDPARHCSLKCRQPGLSAGMTVNVTNALYGLVAQPFRIQGLTTSYPDTVAPEFEVEFADAPVTLAAQMVAIQAQRSDTTPTSSDVQKLAAVVAANTLGTVAYSEATSRGRFFDALELHDRGSCDLSRDLASRHASGRVRANGLGLLSRGLQVGEERSPGFHAPRWCARSTAILAE